MTNIKKKNKVLSFITMLVLLPMLLLSIFAPLHSRQIKDVGAAYDSTVAGDSYFNNSPFPLYASYTSNALTDPNSEYNWLSNEGILLNFAFRLYPHGMAAYNTGLPTLAFLSTSYARGGTSTDVLGFGQSSASPFLRQYKIGNVWQDVSQFSSLGYALTYNTAHYFYLDYIGSGFNGNYRTIEVAVVLSGVLTSDFVKVDVTHTYDNSQSCGSTTLIYYTADGTYLRFRIYVRAPESFLPVYRTYYFNDSSFNDDEFYNSGYNAGYSSGYDDGYNLGNQEGYIAGDKAGQVVGYNNGYNAGVEAGNNYSFLSLIGAVIDAPVSAFTSLLNFELLGINLLSFITGLLTLAIIIFIIKLCLGGK